MKTGLPVYFSSVIAVTAEYRSTGLGLEGYLSALTTLGAGSVEQLLFRSKTWLNCLVITVPNLTCLSGLAAGWATLRGMGMAFSLVSLLLFYAESEGNATIIADN